MYEIRHFVGYSGLDAVERDWRSLLARQPRRRPMHFPEWYRAYLDGFADDKTELHLFCFYDAGTPITILPLRFSLERILGLPSRQFSLISRDGIELADAVCDRDADIREIMNLLIAFLNGHADPGWDIISLRHFLEDSLLLKSGDADFWRMCLRPHRRGHYNRLQQTPEGFFQTLSRNYRKRVRNALNRLKSSGEVVFTYTRGPDLLPDHFQQFLEVEASGWKGERGTGTAIKWNPEMERF